MPGVAPCAVALWGNWLRVWQRGLDHQQHQQRHGGVDQPQRCRTQPLQIGAQCQHPREQDTHARAGEHQCAKTRLPALSGQVLSHAGERHHHPRTGDAGAQAQRHMRPEPVGPERGQGQQHTQPQPGQQAPAHLGGAVREHRVEGAEQVAQVIGGGYQPGGGQADLAFADQVRQLRGEGESADAHGHHQGNEAGQQAHCRGHGRVPVR